MPKKKKSHFVDNGFLKTKKTFKKENMTPPHPSPSKKKEKFQFEIKSFKSLYSRQNTNPAVLLYTLYAHSAQR